MVPVDARNDPHRCTTDCSSYSPCQPCNALCHSVKRLLQPVEFCSDVFLLPLGSPPQDTLDSLDSEDEGEGRSPPLPPSPPPLDPALYEMLLKSLDNNNVPPPPRAKNYSSKTKAKWEEDTAEHFI